MRNNTPTLRYKVASPVQAVKLADHPGSSLRDPTATLLSIPPGVVIEIAGRVAASGLVNIRWNGEFFSVFNEDLQANAAPVIAAEA